MTTFSTNGIDMNISDIITRYEIKLQDQKTESEKLQEDLEPIDE